MCFPNDAAELDRIRTQAKIMDAVLDVLMNPRSPRARGAHSPTPSQPSAGAGDVDNRQLFDRDAQATGV